MHELLYPYRWSITILGLVVLVIFLLVLWAPELGLTTP